MAVDSDHWEQLQELFHLASITAEPDRARVLEDACPDPVLRARALELLGAVDLDVEDEAVEAPKPTVLTGKIGPYTLIRLLGSGGIGSVYLVERMVGKTMLRSAMKVLAPHAAGPTFIERFLREEKILASLDHAHITRLLDAGFTENEQPYLVMEYVEGVHLDVYCDSKKLDVNDRLRMFLHVCDAVAYAHRNLVVHLDLKPSNILVTADGTVKLLDFGTSKLMEPDSMLTSTVMATPAYASPEQLRNDAVTTACDVYSLGVILFELLAGRRPGGKASVAAMMERAIAEREPERLTHALTNEAAEKRGLTQLKLEQTLRGDLATIVNKCLRPRPRDRYASLDSLAEDIQRYLNGWPVLARPQTSLYLLGKFVRRKRKMVAAAAALLIVVIASVAYAGWRQEQAVLEGQRAIRMQTFLYRLLYLANSNYTGKPTFTVPEFLHLGVKKLPEYIKDPADLRKAQLSLAESMYENNDLDGAAKTFDEVIANAKSAGDDDTEAEAESTAGEVAYLRGQTDRGLELTTHALEVSKRRGVLKSTRVWTEIYYASNRDRLGYKTDDNLKMLQAAAVVAGTGNVLPSHEVGDVFYTLGWDLKNRERYGEAESAYNRALSVYLRDDEAKCDQSSTYGELAAVKDLGGDPRGSLPLYQQAYEGVKACEGADSRAALEQQDRMAGAMIKVGRAKEALPLLESILPAWRKLAGTGPDMAEPLSYLTRAYVALGKFADAEKSAMEFFEVQDGKVAPTDRRIGEAQLLWARALMGEHRDAEALPHAQAAVTLLHGGSSNDAKQMDMQAAALLAELRALLHS
jgi:serine/threonine-protein kinase